MKYQEAEDYIYKSYLEAQSALDYSSPDSEKRHPGLTRDLLEHLSGTPAVVVTGSKGKGSVSAMISRIMGAYVKTGLFTSPHISSFRERFRVDGTMISEEEFIRNLEGLRPKFEDISKGLQPGKFISPIGMQAAIALRWFREMATEFNVFECGKGARYDDVNNIIHKFAVINSIFLEHTRELGGSIEEIALDKSHAITGNEKTVFVGLQNEAVMRVIETRARELNVPLKIYGRDFESFNISYSRDGMNFDVRMGERIYKDLKIPLLGEHQTRNAALAIALCQEERSDLEEEKLRRSLASLEWPGRMQILSSEPFVMLDACINEASTENIRQTLDFLGIGDITLIVGIPEDKDYRGVVKGMAGYASEVVLTMSQNPHYSFSPSQLQQLDVNGVWKENVGEAISYGVNRGRPVVILGTTSVVSEVLSMDMLL